MNAKQIKTLRQIFSEVTGLPTYAANKWTTGGTFDADAPHNDIYAERLQDFLADAENRGFTVDFDIRNTRMTITVS